MSQIQDGARRAIADGHTREEVMQYLNSSPKYSQQMQQAKQGGVSDNDLDSYIFGSTQPINTQTVASQSILPEKKSFLENAFGVLHQLQRGQSALFRPIEEQARTLAGEGNILQKLGGVGKNIAMAPVQFFQGLTAPDDKFSDVTSVLRAGGVDPYRMTTDAEQESIKARNEGDVLGQLKANLKGQAGSMLAVGETAGNLILDPANLIGVGMLTKGGKAALLAKEAIQAGVPLAGKIGQGVSAVKDLVPLGETLAEQAGLGQRSLVTFADVPLVPKEVSSAVIGSVEDISNAIGKTKFGQALSQMFVETKDPTLRLAKSVLRSKFHTANTEAIQGMEGLRDAITEGAKAEGRDILSFAKEVSDASESKTLFNKSSPTVKALAKEYNNTSQEFYSAREQAGLAPALLGDQLTRDIAELQSGISDTLGRRGAAIMKAFDVNRSKIEEQIGRIEENLYDEALRPGNEAIKQTSLDTPINNLDRKIETKQKQIDLTRHDLINARKLIGDETPVSKMSFDENDLIVMNQKAKAVDPKDYDRVANIYGDWEKLKKEKIAMEDQKARLVGVQELTGEAKPSDRFDALQTAQRRLYGQYFNELDKMQQLLNKADPAVVRQAQAKIDVLQSSLAANPKYAIHSITPEAKALIEAKGNRVSAIGGSEVDIGNESDIARTFNLTPQIAEDLKQLGVKQLKGVGATVNEIRIQAGMKPLVTGGGEALAVPGRSLTRQEVNVLAREGKLPGFEGQKINEFFYEDPVIARTIETMRTNKQLAVKEFLDDVEKNFADPNGVETHGIKVRPDIAEDLNRYIVTIQNPKNEFGEAVMNVFRNSTSAWKFLATVPNPGFHIRNALNGVWANVLAGVKNPMRYKQADDILNMAAGAKPSRFVDSVLGEIERNTGRKFTADDIKDLSAKYGFDKASLVARDIDQLGIASQPSKVRQFAEKLQEKGQGISNAVEARIRLPLFLDQLAKGHTPDAAAQTVFKYQFDYGDATRTEQVISNTVIPFYKWLKKNIALQVEEMIQRPGVYNTMTGKLLREVEKTGGGETEQEKTYKPDYYRDFMFTKTGLKGSKGNPLYVNPNLGFQDLRNLDAANAGQNLISASNPLISSLLQLAFNRDYRGREIAQHVTPDQAYLDAGARVPAKGAGKILPLLAPGQFGSLPDRYTGAMVPTVPPRAQYLLNRIPFLNTLSSLIPEPGSEKIPLGIGETGVDSGALSSLGGIKLSPLDINQAMASKLMELQRIMNDKKIQQMKRGY